MTAKNICFKEIQRFTQWWIWLFLIGLGLLPIIGIYRQLFQGIPFGDNPMSNEGLLVFSLFSFGFIWFFHNIKLITQIDPKGIIITLSPFTKRNILWEEIDSLELVTYNPFWVGGYGIRFTFKYGTVYNIKGNEGIFIKLTNGKKTLIGTQKSKELKELLS
jgi:hypothetical protein